MADFDEQIDPISDLPMNVIDSILQRLPIHELVKTSILSKKWRYTWTSVSRIQFENNFFEKYKQHESPEASGIITQVLVHHTGPVLTFILYLSDYTIKMECLAEWILILSRRGVKRLGLVNEQTDPYQTPLEIYSCEDLSDLYLHNFKMSIAPNFRGFKNLLDLHLCEVVFEPGALECLLSGCPLLVQLTLYYCSGFERINVSAPSLKYLNIEDDEVIKSISSKQAQNLTFIQLFADGPGDNIERNWVSNLLKASPNVERLSLGTGYVKVLSAGSNPQLQFTAIKYLKLDGVNFNEAREFLFIISLLKSSSNLEKLVIKCNSMDVESQQISNEFDYSNCYFSQLQSVKIAVKTSYKPALNLVRFVLARSPALKVLAFKVAVDLNQTDAFIMLSISCDLLEMERASPRAQVKFLGEDLSE